MSTNKAPLTSIIEDTQTLWGAQRKSMGCSSCRRIFLVPHESMETACPICGKGQLETQPVRMRSAMPELILPFRVGEAQLRSIYDACITGVSIKPEDFTPEALLTRTRAIYWPLWLVDCDVTGDWQMEAGFDYQVESTKESYINGQWTSRKQIEDRIRWEPRLGELTTHVDNIPVPALEEHQNRDQMTGGYPLDQALPFSLQQLGQTLLEVPDLPPTEAWSMAKPQINTAAGKICAEAAGAGHHRNFAVKADYHKLHWTQFLLPLYATHYLDDEGQAQVLIVNGYTGGIKGPRLASPKRGMRIAGILGGLAAGLFLLALIGFLLTALFPPAGLIAAFLVVLGVGVGIAAIVPAVWPGMWNRKQAGPRIAIRGQENANH